MFSATYRRTLGVAATFLLTFTVILGVLYPFAMWGAGRVFAHNADGSMVTGADGQVVGSALIGQEFDDPALFHSRPSASGYDALDSGATNLAKGDETLLRDVAERRARIAQEENVAESAVPDDAITASASGLDPHISPEYARLQIPRVAKAQGLSEDTVAGLVLDSTQGQGVNVLLLNLAVLDVAKG
ncbi:potassium-transporting ATPase subunit C [Corynebacterium aquilae]|uniref:Potassium-transporting ATPase KdpC subunit n=1 Tax=Corynebacterium aquilae DSM 44791 TaxID=1431546 RepID=A0A1L7CIE9_9CORY|nr:potassium-transporting ATPase subunit C [Corynebacterium aquilae]APT85585.1 hypothetical protein CAQU_11635 [Corynebacterium aquilae DSM 44791]